MKCAKYLAAATGFAFAVLAPKLAVSSDFTFHVKVDVANLNPQVAAVEVYCAAGTDVANAKGADNNNHPNPIGWGSADHKFCPGEARSFNGVVTVSFDAQPGKDASRAAAYFCDIRLVDKNGKHALCTTTSCDAWEQVQVQGIVEQIQGTIVRGSAAGTPGQQQIARPRC